VKITRLYAIPIAVVALAVAAFKAAVLAENIDPLNNNSRFARGENAGWLNAEPADPQRQRPRRHRQSGWGRAA
jgi:hypothetical protein